MMTNLFTGARYLLTGFFLINRKGVRPFAYIPIAISVVLFSLAIAVAMTQFDAWITNMMPSWIPDMVLGWIMWIVWPLLAGLLTLIVFFSFSIVANILAAPFNGALAEAVELKLTEQTIKGISWQQTLKDAPKMLFNEMKKIIYFLLWMIPLFIFSWIPVVNIVAPLLWLLVSSWFLALEYHDYPMGNHQLFFPQQRQLLKQHCGLALGFGFATLIATMIPFVNFLVIPSAVAGATALYLEKVKA